MINKIGQEPVPCRDSSIAMVAWSRVSWPALMLAGRLHGSLAFQQAGSMSVCSYIYPNALQSTLLHRHPHIQLHAWPSCRMSAQPLGTTTGRMDIQEDGLQVIVMASRKGGAGKTTLSSHLAVEAERAGAGTVAMADMDPQGGLADWFNARQAETPIFVDASKGLAMAVKSCRAGGVDLLIIDTPPSVTDTISAVVREADLVVVPVRPSPNDLRAVAGTVELVKRAKKPMAFVVTQTTPRARITAEAAIALSQHGTVAPSMLASRIDFATSMTDGRTAGELDPSSRSAAEVAALWIYLETRLKEIARG